MEGSFDALFPGVEVEATSLSRRSEPWWTVQEAHTFSEQPSALGQ